MFAERYALFDSTWACRSWQVQAKIANETGTYGYIKKLVRSHGWKYKRVETIDQDGFPDIMVFKGPNYWAIESKMLTKRKLVRIEDDLKWQPGQLPFMKRSHTLNMNYMLLIYGKGTMASIIGDYNEQRVDYPDFIRQAGIRS